MVLSMERWKGKVAVMTGASAGIGAAICEHLCEHGLKMVAIARRQHRLEQLREKVKDKAGSLHPLQANVCDEEAIIAVFELIQKTYGTVAILVNNAGILRTTNLCEGDGRLWRDVIETNVLGLCYCTREAVQMMRRNNIRGHIIHMNSVAGHGVLPFQNMNVYCPSKHAITALTEVLREEFNHLKLKIKVTSISPGLVNTEIMDAAGFDPEGIQAHFKTAPCLHPADVADAVIYALSTAEHVLIKEITIKPVGESF